MPQDWHVVKDNPVVPQTMHWELERAQVFWEMHDGVIDEVPRETVERLWLCLQHRDHSRPFVYVKPNLSPTGSKAIIEFARRRDVILLTCPRWSYYDDVMLACGLFPNREKLRFVRSRKTSNQIFFMGGTGSYEFDRSVYSRQPFEYGISGKDARMWRLHEAPEPDIFTVNRQVVLDLAQSTWGSRLTTLTSLHPADYIRHLSGEREPMAAYCFQPHGNALRHAIYECMALGIPSVIPECSYLDEITRQCNIVYADNKIPVLPDRRPDLEAACIDAFERHMTPKAIVDNVLNQLRERNLY